MQNPGIGTGILRASVAILEAMGLKASNDHFDDESIPTTLRNQDAFMVTLGPSTLSEGDPGMNNKLPIARPLVVRVILPTKRAGLAGGSKLVQAQEKAADLEEQIINEFTKVQLTTSVTIVNPVSIGTAAAAIEDDQFLILTAEFEVRYPLTIG